MYSTRDQRRSVGRWALVTAIAAAVVCAGGISVAAFGLTNRTPEGGGAVIPSWVTTTVPKLSRDSGVRALARSVPVNIRIPVINVSAPVERVGKNANGTVQVPPLEKHNLTGWYDYGPAPGQVGSSVILGHVDSYTGISVFYHLKDLRPGNKIYVTLADGTVATFAVDGVQKVAKTDFPTASVYDAHLDYPSLRLITCGGYFDQATGYYLDNVIVYAHLV